jgi:hypothetical protein
MTISVVDSRIRAGTGACPYIRDLAACCLITDTGPKQKRPMKIGRFQFRRNKWPLGRIGTDKWIACAQPSQCFGALCSAQVIAALQTDQIHVTVFVTLEADVTTALRATF